MIDFYEAQNTVLQNVSILPTERVRLLDSLDRFLGSDVISNINIPPASNSALDGFVFSYDDIKDKTPPIELEIKGEIKAGDYSSKDILIGKNETYRIMTGAIVPEGENCVIGVEDTEIEGNKVKILKKVDKYANIRFAGEDIKKGSTVFKKGTKITPSVLGVLAALGKSYIEVFQKPIVGILSTGDEIIEPGDFNPGLKIYSSNSYTLISLVKKAGGIPVYYGIAEDNKESLKSTLSAMKRCDIIITTGGVSMGDYDLVKIVLDELGFKRIFWKVAVKPGKPLLFGLLEKSLVFGLPGNPVSTVTSFLEFVRPSMLKMQGSDTLFSPVFKGILTKKIQKKKGRLNLIKARYTVSDGKIFVTPQRGQGSGILSTLAAANCIIFVPADTEVIEKGEEVDIKLLDLF